MFSAILNSMPYPLINKEAPVGWRNITAGGHLMQVRGGSGGGTRNICIPLTAAETDILSEAKKLFLPNGTSSLGCESEFIFDLIGFHSHVVEDNVIVGFMYETIKPVLTAPSAEGSLFGASTS